MSAPPWVAPDNHFLIGRYMGITSRCVRPTPTGTSGKSRDGRHDHPFACPSTYRRTVLICIGRLRIETVEPVLYFIQTAE
jgi:hypothetical protein